MFKGCKSTVIALVGLLQVGAMGCGSGATTGGAADAGVLVPDGGGAPGAMGGLAPLDAASADAGETRRNGDAGSCVAKVPPSCTAAPPEFGAAQAWRHGAPGGLGANPRHRGRDLFLAAGAPQWLIARFAYGLLDTPLADEDVGVYVLRGCGVAWEKLATVRTTDDPPHAPVEGIEDDRGRVFFQIPSDKILGPGRHRVRLIVAGDLTFTELFVEVVAPGTPVFVADVDGTLTSDENAEFGALLTGTLPMANADAAAVLGALASKGYRPLYLTARAEALVPRTRQFLEEAGFPAGILNTTSAGLGASGAAAASYKTAALALLASKGLKPAYAFGNSDTDALAYESAAIQPLFNRVFFQFTDAQFNGRRIETYAQLLPEITALPNACP